MERVILNILVVFSGLMLGSLVNMGIIQYGPNIIPLPEGIDMSTMEGMKDAMLKLEDKNFIVPLFGHAMGSFVAGLLIGRFARTLPMLYGLLPGLVFLLGGAYMIFKLGGPLWFKIVDLGLCYIPAALLGAWLGSKIRQSGNTVSQ